MADKQLQTLQTMQEIVGDIQCSMGGYRFKFLIKEYNDAPYLQIIFDAPCSLTGKITEQICRKWILQYTMSKSEVVRTAFKAAKAAYEHECEEEFRYKGASVYSPHTDVEALVTMRNLKQYNDDVRVPLVAEPITLEAHLRDESNFGELLITGFHRGLFSDVQWADQMYGAVKCLSGRDWDDFCNTFLKQLVERADVDTVLEVFIRQSRMAAGSIDQANFNQKCGLISEVNARIILNWFRYCYKMPELR